MGEPARKYIEEQPTRRRQIEIIGDMPQVEEKRVERKRPKARPAERRKNVPKTAKRRTKSKTRAEKRSRQAGAHALLTPAQALSILVMLTAFVGLLIANLISYNEVSMVQNQMKEMRQDVKALQSEADLLTMKLTPYTDPDRIAKLAEERLHMVKPQENAIVSIQANPQDVYKEPGSLNQLADQGR